MEISRGDIMSQAITLTTYKLVKLPNDDRTLDQRLADHMDEVRKLGEKQAVKNHQKEGTLVEYSEKTEY